MVFLVTKAALAATIVGVGVTFGALSYLARRSQEQNSQNGLQPINHDASGSSRGFPSFSLFPSSNDPPPPSSSQGNSPLFSFPSRGFRLFGSSPAFSSFSRDCDCRLIHECSTFFGGASHSFRLRRTCGFQGFQRKICCDEGPAFFSTPPPNLALDNVKSMHEHFSSSSTGCKHNHDANGGTSGCSCAHYNPFESGGSGGYIDVAFPTEATPGGTGISSTTKSGQGQDEEQRPVKEEGRGKTRLNFPEINEYFRDDIDKSDKLDEGVPIEAVLFPEGEDTQDFKSDGRNHKINLAFGEDDEATEDGGDGQTGRKVPSLLEYFPEEGSSGLLANLATTTGMPSTLPTEGSVDVEMSTDSISSTSSSTTTVTINSVADLNEKSSTSRPSSTTVKEDEKKDRMQGFFDIPEMSDGDKDYLFDKPETTTVKNILSSEPPPQEDFPDVTETVRHGSGSNAQNLELGKETLVINDESVMPTSSTNGKRFEEPEITTTGSSTDDSLGQVRPEKEAKAMYGKTMSTDEFNERVTTMHTVPDDEENVFSGVPSGNTDHDEKQQTITEFLAARSAYGSGSSDSTTPGEMEPTTQLNPYDDESPQKDDVSTTTAKTEDRSSSPVPLDLPESNDELTTTTRALISEDVSGDDATEAQVVTEGPTTMFPSVSSESVTVPMSTSTQPPHEEIKNEMDDSAGAMKALDSTTEQVDAIPTTIPSEAMKVMDDEPEIINLMTTNAPHDMETTSISAGPDASSEDPLVKSMPDYSTTISSEIQTTTLPNSGLSSLTDSSTDPYPTTISSITILGFDDKEVVTHRVLNLEKTAEDSTTTERAVHLDAVDMNDEVSETTTEFRDLSSNPVETNIPREELESTTIRLETTTFAGKDSIPTTITAMQADSAEDDDQFKTTTSAVAKPIGINSMATDEEGTTKPPLLNSQDEESTVTISEPSKPEIKSETTFAPETTTNPTLAADETLASHDLQNDDVADTTTVKMTTVDSPNEMDDVLPTSAPASPVTSKDDESSTFLPVMTTTESGEDDANLLKHTTVTPEKEANDDANEGIVSTTQSTGTDQGDAGKAQTKTDEDTTTIGSVTTSTEVQPELVSDTGSTNPSREHDAMPEVTSTLSPISVEDQDDILGTTTIRTSDLESYALVKGSENTETSQTTTESAFAMADEDNSGDDSTKYPAIESLISSSTPRFNDLEDDTTTYASATKGNMLQDDSTTLTPKRQYVSTEAISTEKLSNLDGVMLDENEQPEITSTMPSPSQKYVTTTERIGEPTTERAQGLMEDESPTTLHNDLNVMKEETTTTSDSIVGSQIQDHTSIPLMHGFNDFNKEDVPTTTFESVSNANIGDVTTNNPLADQSFTTTIQSLIDDLITMISSLSTTTLSTDDVLQDMQTTTYHPNEMETTTGKETKESATASLSGINTEVYVNRFFGEDQSEMTSTPRVGVVSQEQDSSTQTLNDDVSETTTVGYSTSEDTTESEEPTGRKVSSSSMGQSDNSFGDVSMKDSVEATTPLQDSVTTEGEGPATTENLSYITLTPDNESKVLTSSKGQSDNSLGDIGMSENESTTSAQSVEDVVTLEGDAPETTDGVSHTTLSPDNGPTTGTLKIIEVPKTTPVPIKATTTRSTDTFDDEAGTTVEDVDSISETTVSIENDETTQTTEPSKSKNIGSTTQSAVETEMEHGQTESAITSRYELETTTSSKGQGVSVDDVEEVTTFIDDDTIAATTKRSIVPSEVTDKSLGEAEMDEATTTTANVLAVKKQTEEILLLPEVEPTTAIYETTTSSEVEGKQNDRTSTESTSTVYPASSESQLQGVDDVTQATLDDDIGSTPFNDETTTARAGSKEKESSFDDSIYTSTLASQTTERIKGLGSAELFDGLMRGVDATTFAPIIPDDEESAEKFATSTALNQDNSEETTISSSSEAPSQTSEQDNGVTEDTLQVSTESGKGYQSDTQEEGNSTPYTTKGDVYNQNPTVGTAGGANFDLESTTPPEDATTASAINDESKETTPLSTDLLMSSDNSDLDLTTQKMKSSTESSNSLELADDPGSMTTLSSAITQKSVDDVTVEPFSEQHDESTVANTSSDENDIPTSTMMYSDETMERTTLNDLPDSKFLSKSTETILVAEMDNPSFTTPADDDINDPRTTVKEDVSSMSTENSSTDTFMNNEDVNTSTIYSGDLDSRSESSEVPQTTEKSEADSSRPTEASSESSVDVLSTTYDSVSVPKQDDITSPPLLKAVEDSTQKDEISTSSFKTFPTTMSIFEEETEISRDQEIPEVSTKTSTSEETQTTQRNDMTTDAATDSIEFSQSIDRSTESAILEDASTAKDSVDLTTSPRFDEDMTTPQFDEGKEGRNGLSVTTEKEQDVTVESFKTSTDRSGRSDTAEESFKDDEESMVTSTMKVQLVDKDSTTIAVNVDQDMTTPPNTTPKFSQTSTEKAFSDAELMEYGSTLPSSPEMTTTVMRNDGTETVQDSTTKSSSSGDEGTTTGNGGIITTNEPQNEPMDDGDMLASTSMKPVFESTSEINLDTSDLKDDSTVRDIITDDDTTTLRSRSSTEMDTTTLQTSVNLDYDDVEGTVEVSPPTFDFNDSSTYQPPDTQDLVTGKEVSSTAQAKLMEPTTLSSSETMDGTTTEKMDDLESKPVRDEVSSITERVASAMMSTTYRSDEMEDVTQATIVPASSLLDEDNFGATGKTTNKMEEVTTMHEDLASTTQGTMNDEIEGEMTTSGDNDTTTLSSEGIDSSISTSRTISVDGTTSQPVADEQGVTTSTEINSGLELDDDVMNSRTEQSTEKILSNDDVPMTTTTADGSIEMTTFGDTVQRTEVQVDDVVDDTTVSSRGIEDSTTEAILNDFKTDKSTSVEEAMTTESELSSDAPVNSLGETHESYAKTTEYPELETAVSSTPNSIQADDDSSTTYSTKEMMSTPLPLMEEEIFMGEDGLPVTEITKTIRREPDTDKTIVELSLMRSRQRNKVTKTVTAIKSGSETTISELTTESPVSTTTGGTTEQSTTVLPESDGKATTEVFDTSTVMEDSSDAALVFDDVTENSTEQETATESDTIPRVESGASESIESKAIQEDLGSEPMPVTTSYEITTTSKAIDEQATDGLQEEAVTLGSVTTAESSLKERSGRLNLIGTTTEKLEGTTAYASMSSEGNLSTEESIVSTTLPPGEFRSPPLFTNDTVPGILFEDEVRTPTTTERDDYMNITTVQPQAVMGNLQDEGDETIRTTSIPPILGIVTETPAAPSSEYGSTTEMHEDNDTATVSGPMFNDAVNGSTSLSPIDRDVSTERGMFDMFDGRDNMFDFTSKSRVDEGAEEKGGQDGNGTSIVTTAGNNDVPDSTPITAEVESDFEGTTSLPEIMESVNKKTLNLETTTEVTGINDRMSSTDSILKATSEGVSTTERSLTAPPQIYSTTPSSPEISHSTESSFIELQEGFNDTLLSFVTTVEPETTEIEASTTEAALALDTTITNAVLQDFYETLFGPSTSSARAKSLDSIVPKIRLPDKSTTTQKPRFKVEVKVGPYNERSLFASETTALERQLERNISHVVEQLLLTTHKNFHLLPNYNECARARGRTGRRKTKVLHFDTENYPWMARVGFWEPAGVLFPCAGTIIAQRYILTSAQCALRRANGTAEIMEILLEGAKNAAAGMSDQPQFKYKVEEVIPHPNYNMITRENDLALIRLAEKIPSFHGSSDVKPICLPFEDGYGVWESLPEAGETAYLGGWGYGLKNMAATVEEMEEAAVTIWSNDNCTHLYRGDREKRVTPKHICAYGKAEKDACRGDSGGPLMAMMTKQKIFFQIGIVSYGPRCGYGVPGVYTRVSEYLTWILDTMRP